MQSKATEVLVRNASTVPELPKTWLWPGWIPMRAITLLEGDPGLGKSTVLCDLAARVSRGELMPPFSPAEYDGYYEQENPGGVLLLSAEDDAETTLVPRLRAAGANLNCIYLVEWAVTPESIRGVVIPLDVDAITRYAHAVLPKVKLIVIDPIMAYFQGATDTFKDSEVRAALKPIQEMATGLECAVVICRHLNKSSRGRSDLYAGGGSIGFTAAARSVIGVQKRKDWDTARWVDFKQIKSNWGPESKPLAFRIEQPPEEPVLEDDDDPYGEETLESAAAKQVHAHLSEMYRPVDWRRPEQIPAPPPVPVIEVADDEPAPWLTIRQQEVRGFLEVLLPRNTTKPAAEILEATNAAEMSKRDVDGAKASMGIQSVQHDKCWYWVRS